MWNILRVVDWAPSKLFHVERGAQRRSPHHGSGVFHVEHCSALRPSFCSMWNTNHHTIAGSEVLTEEDFLLPTNRSLRNEWGTGIGSCQSQVLIFWISSRSRAPIHKITCFAAICSDLAHSRKPGNSPRAREQMYSRGAISSPSSS